VRVVRAGFRIEPNLTSMGKLILAKMREGDERMMPLRQWMKLKA
jgi:DNA-binding IclR family transcriptional regulator